MLLMPMTDPMDALVKLQAALDSGVPLQQQPCTIYKDLRLIADQPAGRLRLTYAKIEIGKVVAVSLFVLTDPIEGIPCFQSGNAVIESMRGKGLGRAILSQGMEELHHGFKKQGANKFYVEGVVSASNEPSNKIARRVLSDHPTPISDAFSGEPALQYLRLLE
jgi:hypothetical protein